MLLLPVGGNHAVLYLGGVCHAPPPLEASTPRRSAAVTSPHLLGPAPGEAFAFLAFLWPLALKEVLVLDAQGCRMHRGAGQGIQKKGTVCPPLTSAAPTWE